MKAKELIARIEAYAPRELAWERDPIGLQLGDPEQEIQTVMTSDQKLCKKRLKSTLISFLPITQ